MIDYPLMRGPNNLKILVVDDELTVLVLTETILRRSGYDVVVARSGKQALELCDELKGKVALVLSDVHMPEMSGLELADCICRLAHPIPMVFMSGFSPTSPLLNGLFHKNQLNSIRFLAKPFVPNDLVSIIERALNEAVPR